MRLPGKSILQPGISHCRQIGTAMAQLHQVGKHFSLHRSNPWGFSQIQSIGKAHCEHLDKDDALLLCDELSFQHEHMDHNLPRSVIHADLFRDNALFDSQFKDDQLSGILDFYTAWHAPLLFDLTISVNNWYLGDDHYLDLNKAKSLLNDNEKHNWPTMLRAASLRFCLSRLSSQQTSRQQFNKEAKLTLDKDPNVLKCLLLKHRENSTFCQSLIYS
ncbi:MAG: phosphotransferase [Thiohalomonas sp.]|nr:phosphotransferase [Thiohalomonas sp.]